MKTSFKFAIPLLAIVLAASKLPAQTASPAYNRSQQKGSHNTEQRDETLTIQSKEKKRCPLKQFPGDPHWGQGRCRE